MVRPPFAEMLRQWRRRRNLSQLDLSLASGVSTRHISCLETGRAKHSREMVIQLADGLAVPLRSRNPMLEAAGFAPMHRQREWSDPELRSALLAVRTLLEAHSPYPAFALDRLYNVIEANRAATVFLRHMLPLWEFAPLNVVRATLHPQGLAPHIGNWAAWRAHVLLRLDQQVQSTGDAELAALRHEVGAYPVAEAPSPPPCPAAPPGWILPLEIRAGADVLRFITTQTVLGSPHDIVLQELTIETLLAADEATGRWLRNMASGSRVAP